ncbi:hypothetical protein [Streptomyces sp. BE230]|uniref:hypothetical protein n=1 Tax=Streptomyces sp. BE230 TaxID=3002526 RepID=UPI002ED23599|nr:hypothetical protein [Streptomyces sp. BE230]
MRPPVEVSVSPRPLPAPGELTWEQSAGRACVWCRRPLTSGAVRAGIVRDQLGAHNLDTEVWAGPCCASATP